MTFHQFCEDFWFASLLRAVYSVTLERHQVPHLSVGALPMPQGSPQDDPEGFKAPCCRFKMFQDAPKTPPRRSQDGPRVPKIWKATLTAMGAQTPSKLRCWIVLGWILDYFRLNFGMSRAVCWAHILTLKLILVWRLLQLEI